MTLRVRQRLHAHVKRIGATVFLAPATGLVLAKQTSGKYKILDPSAGWSEVQPAEDYKRTLDGYDGLGAARVAVALIEAERRAAKRAEKPLTSTGN